MKTFAKELRDLVKDFTVKFNRISESEFSSKPHPDKWSKKEILGHLVDSAHTNLRRLVVAQYESTPPKIAYDQNFWVKVNGYANAPTEDIISLWRLMNERYADILNNMPVANYTCLCDTGGSELHTLSWLAEDYIRHLNHHLNQIIVGSFGVA